MNEYELIITPRRQGFSAADSTELDVLVRLQAPERPVANEEHRRHKLNLAFVIDRSGSMAGQPLDEAKRCVALMTESLQPDDRAACVLYDGDVNVLVPSTPMADRGLFARMLAGVRSGGRTNLHGGWLTGAQLVANTLTESSGELARVILLSDGCANVGLTDADAIAGQCEQLASADVSTSTYGLGRNLNEDLMIAMAQKGAGNHYYGEMARDLLGPFQEEFDLLRDLCARRVQLHAKAAPGVSVRVLNEYNALGAFGWALPDVAYGSEAWAMLRLTIDADALGAGTLPGPARLVDVSVQFLDTDSDTPRELSGELRLPPLRDDELHGLPDDERVAARVKELEAAGLQIRIRDAARRGDWPAVDQLVAEAEFNGIDNAWLSGVVRSVRRHAEQRDVMMLSKEASFSASRMRRRLDEKNAQVSESFDSGTENRKARYLRRKVEQGRE